jgi:glycosyltransferase involved in cell wall biosynthesis
VSLAQGNENWFPKEKMVLIYNGVDTRLPLVKQKKIYERVSDEVIIGNAARLTEQKGQKYLIEMAKILKEKNLKFKLSVHWQWHRTQPSPKTTRTLPTPPS